jgi:hypothetical protein
MCATGFRWLSGLCSGTPRYEKSAKKSGRARSRRRRGRFGWFKRV